MPPQVQSVYAHHLQLFSDVLQIGLQLKQYLYKLRTGGIQKQCTVTVHSEDCFMHYDAWINVQNFP